MLNEIKLASCKESVRIEVGAIFIMIMSRNYKKCDFSMFYLANLTQTVTKLKKKLESFLPNVFL